MFITKRNDASKTVSNVVQNRGRGSATSTKSFWAPIFTDIKELVTFIGVDSSITILQGVVRGFGRQATIKANTEVGPLTDENVSKWSAVYNEYMLKATDGATTKAKLIEEYNNLTQLIVAIAGGAATGATSVTLSNGSSYDIPQIEGMQPMQAAMIHLAELSVKSKKLNEEIEKKSKKKSEESESDDDDDDDEA